eukprot:CCRYP_017957-RA/>CCRYP_017957-RA protein AED:0.25 eAED:0.28 QI:0/0/0.5/1/0/0/2/92/186
MVDFGDETHILQKRIILPIKPLPNHPPLHHPKPMRTRSPKPLQTIRRPAHAPSPTRLGKPPQHLLDIKRWFFLGRFLLECHMQQHGAIEVGISFHLGRETNDAICLGFFFLGGQSSRGGGFVLGGVGVGMIHSFGGVVIVSSFLGGGLGGGLGFGTGEGEGVVLVVSVPVGLGRGVLGMSSFVGEQ